MRRHENPDFSLADAIWFMVMIVTIILTGFVAFIAITTM